MQKEKMQQPQLDAPHCGSGDQEQRVRVSPPAQARVWLEVPLMSNTDENYDSRRSHAIQVANLRSRSASMSGEETTSSLLRSELRGD